MVEELEQYVEELLWPAIVCGKDTEFGLRWRSGTADEPEFLVGGWLTQMSSDLLSRKRNVGKLHFYCFEDDHSLIRQNKDEDHRGTKVFKYDDIHQVKFVSSKAGVKFFRLTYGKDNKSLELKSIGDDDDTICRWVASIRFRCGERLYGDAFEEDKKKALSVAVWCQCIARRNKAMAKIERMRERRKGVMATLGYWWNGSYNDSDSEDEQSDDGFGDGDDGEELLDDEEEGGSMLVTIFSAVMTDLYSMTIGEDKPMDKEKSKLEKAMTSTGARRSSMKRIVNGGRNSLSKMRKASLKKSVKSAIKEDEEMHKQLERRATASANAMRLRRNSSHVQQIYELPRLKRNEVEDELWENQRWLVGKGWKGKGNLIPTDRSPFSDRLGHRGCKALSQYPVPAAWSISREFAVDKSGVPLGRCDKEGWSYQVDFGPLDSDLARGTTRPNSAKKHIVRRRRWYRRRTRDFLPMAGHNPLVLEGWLGKRSTKTHRWVSRYFVLSRGLDIGGKRTGVRLTYFRYSFKSYEEFRYSQDMQCWSELRPKAKAIHSIRLDDCKVADDVATAARPGYFAITLAEETTPRYFNAGTAVNRDSWVSAIRIAVREQIKQFTLSRTLRIPANGQISKVDRYENTILDRMLPVQVDEAMQLLFFDDSVVERILFAGNASEVEIKPWTNGAKSGSRREITYVAAAKPKEKVPETDVLRKLKIVMSKQGEGYQIDSSTQMFRVQYGGIYQIELRFVLVLWEPNKHNTRLIVSQRTNVRSADKELQMYINSVCKKQMLNYYSTIWLPTVKSILKTATPKNQVQKIVSPSGIRYELPNNEPNMKQKVLSVFGGIAPAS